MEKNSATDRKPISPVLPEPVVLRAAETILVGGGFDFQEVSHLSSQPTIPKAVPADPC